LEDVLRTELAGLQDNLNMRATQLLETVNDRNRLSVELSTAQERISRLEEAGDAMFPWAERVGQEFWTKAKETSS
jgi:hypothetical protein